MQILNKNNISRLFLKLLPLTMTTSLLAQTTPTFAGGIDTDNLINEIRFAVGMVVGFSSNSAYSHLVCGGQTVNSTNCQGPPKEGILGLITTITNKLPTIAQNAGISSCSAAPSSGSVTGTDSAGTSYTLTFSTPKHTIPSSWLNGGNTFDHRVAFSSSVGLGGTASIPLNLAIEFNCGNNSPMYTAISMPMLDSNTGAAQMPGYSYNREIVMYNGPVDSSTNGIEVYMAEHTRNSAATARTTDFMRIIYNPTSNSFQLWSVISSNPSSSSGNLVGRLFMNGNYSTGVASVMYDGMFGTSGTNNSITSTVTGGSNSTSTAVITPSGYSFTPVLSLSSNGTLVQHQGCITLTAAGAASAPTSNALCTGMPITAPTGAPALSSSGSFTLQWVTVTMPDLLEQLGNAGPTS